MVVWSWSWSCSLSCPVTLGPENCQTPATPVLTGLGTATEEGLGLCVVFARAQVKDAPNERRTLNFAFVYWHQVVLKTVISCQTHPPLPPRSTFQDKMVCPHAGGNFSGWKRNLFLVKVSKVFVPQRCASSRTRFCFQEQRHLHVCLWFDCSFAQDRIFHIARLVMISIFCSQSRKLTCTESV